MSVAMDVQDEGGTEDEVWPEGVVGTEDPGLATMLPSPTYPGAMMADEAGAPEATLTPYGGGSRSEAPDNKKPYLLVRLGHKLCGFSR